MRMNQLSIFSDASVHFYATAVYLQSVEENSTMVNLVLLRHDWSQWLRGGRNVKN